MFSKVSLMCTVQALDFVSSRGWTLYGPSVVCRRGGYFQCQGPQQLSGEYKVTSNPDLISLHGGF